MLAVVKTPHTEISINGDGSDAILKFLSSRFQVEVLSDTDHDDETVVNIKETDYWKNVTPGSLLAGFRLKHDKTQAELADLSGVSQVMISDYETNKRKFTRKAAIKFGKALGEKPDSFFP